MSAHALYVTAAYAITAIVLAGLIGWILLDQRARKRELAELEAAGVRRRSDKAEAAKAVSRETETPTRGRRLFVLLPLLVFLGLAGLFLSQLLSGRDVSEVPSALIGLPAPQTKLPALEGSNLPGLDSKTSPARSRWSTCSRHGARRAGKSIRCCLGCRRTSAS